MPDVLDIVVILKHVEHLLHVLDIVLIGQLDIAVLGDHFDLCGKKLIPGGGERIGDCGLGLGRRLYDVIERISRAQNILNLNACIAYPKIEDEYLTKNSVQFHEHLGFKYVGEFHDCAYKFGRWYNMVWMEKSIGEHDTAPAPVVPFVEMDWRDVEEILGKE